MRDTVWEHLGKKKAQLRMRVEQGALRSRVDEDGAAHDELTPSVMTLTGSEGEVSKWILVGSCDADE